MSHFICPVCKEALTADGHSCRCPNGHCYDRAKGGYVNLLMSQNKKEKRHGDDRAMVLARTRFLEAGYYQPLLDALAGAVKRRAAEGCVLLDCGCGEGFYSGGIYQVLAGEGAAPSLIGVDISKEAVRAFAKRCPQAEAAVASAFKLPIQSGSCHMVLSVFAPYEPAEVCRVLRPGGFFLKAYPLEKHLLSLKKLVYDQVYENKLPSKAIPGLALAESRRVEGRIQLDSQEAIFDLFMMTPYFYKTSRAGQEKLRAASRLDTEIAFGVGVYQNLRQ